MIIFFLVWMRWWWGNVIVRAMRSFYFSNIQCDMRCQSIRFLFLSATDADVVKCFFIISSEVSNVFHTFCWRLWYTYYICMWIQARFLLYIVKPKKPKVILFKLFPLILHLHPISWLSHVFIVKTHFRSGMVFPLFFTYFLVKYVRTDPISFH